jgi:hypothetical protein
MRNEYIHANVYIHCTCKCMFVLVHQVMNKIGAVALWPLLFLVPENKHLSRQIRNDLAALFSTVQSFFSKRRQKM